jgi:hypothetical protein
MSRAFRTGIAGNWWREAGSNCRPTGYESVALTI